MYLLLLCQMRNIDSMKRGNALASNRRNSVPCTVRTSRQRSCNQRVGCLQWLGSRAFGPSKWSGPRLLSTTERKSVKIFFMYYFSEYWLVPLLVKMLLRMTYQIKWKITLQIHGRNERGSNIIIKSTINKQSVFSPPRLITNTAERVFLFWKFCIVPSSDMFNAILSNFSNFSLF